MTPKHLCIAIIGSGFAGSILARALSRQGHTVTLLERGHHPRFALGESSTPLAAIALERLAERWDLPDLHNLATYERWSEHHPTLRRGLKRGFTFLDHTRSSRQLDRLLVAASPEDRCADCHWLRSDVDQYLVERAREEGILVLEGLQLDALERRESTGEWQWSGRTGTEVRSGRVDIVIDGSGAAGWLPRQLGLAPTVDPVPRTALMASHFEGVQPLPAIDGDPYPPGRAAIHHLIEEGWIYELPFDHGVTSLGLIVDADRSQRLGVGDLSALDPKLLDTLWLEVIHRYPALSSRFGEARRVAPWATSSRLQRRWSRAAGPNWALLPSTFVFWSPLFSTGIAWSLVAVERLAEILSPDQPRSIRSGLEGYGEQLQLEAEHLRRLAEAAYRTLDDLDRFHAVALVYFAAASFGEASQRLRDRGPDGRSWAFSGFLGSGDPVVDTALQWVLDQLDLPSGQQVPASVWVDRMLQLLAPRDIAGLDQPMGPGRYEAETAVLRLRRDRLGPEYLEVSDFEERLRC